MSILAEPRPADAETVVPPAHTGSRDGSSRPLLARDPGLVQRCLRRGDRRPARRLGGDRPRRAHPGRRAHRLRQDAGRVPLVARPARRHARRRRTRSSAAGCSTSRPLKALAVDVERNLRAPLAGIRQAAVRLGLPQPDVAGRAALRRHPGRGAPAARPPPAGHPHHHAGVAVPDAHQRGPGVAARRGDGDRRRGARGLLDQARRAPGADPGAARRAADPAGAAGRAVGDGAADRGGGPVPGRRAGRRPWCSRRPPRRSSCRSWCRSRTWPSSASRPARCTGRRPGRSGGRRSGRRSRSGCST